MKTDSQQGKKQVILLADNDTYGIGFIKDIFAREYDFIETYSANRCLTETTMDVWGVCGVFLGGCNGKNQQLRLLQSFYDRGITNRIPVFAVDFSSEPDFSRAVGLGVADVVHRGTNTVLLKNRVKLAIDLFNSRKEIKNGRQHQEKWIKDKTEELIQRQRNTIQMLSAAIEFRDTESGWHTQRIYSITKHLLTNTAMGEGYTQEEIEKISFASYMHDIGKIAVSDVILNKPGRLTKEEYNVMKSHTVKGARFIDRIQGKNDYFEYARDIALNHHERRDGSGYPQGLKGEEISIPAQVVSIADAYDALVNTRAYKKSYNHDTAVEMLKNGECGVFSPKLMECFLQEEQNLRKLYEDGFGDDVFAEEYINAARDTGGSPDFNDIANDLLLLTTAVQSAYDMIICANLTKNSYYMIDYDNFLTHKAKASGVYDELIIRGASTVPQPYNRVFESTFNRYNLLKKYSDGESTVSLVHPQYTDAGRINTVETTVHFVKDPRSEDILEITLARYIK